MERNSQALQECIHACQYWSSLPSRVRCVHRKVKGQVSRQQNLGNYEGVLAFELKGR